jgi:hypothetical protein
MLNDQEIKKANKDRIMPSLDYNIGIMPSVGLKG